MSDLLLYCCDCCCLFAIYEKISNTIVVNKDKQLLSHALECLNSLENYTVEDVLFDSCRQIYAHYADDIIIKIKQYLESKNMDLNLKETPLIFMVELGIGQYKGILLPRLPPQNVFPICDSEIIAFTIDTEHGLQIVDDDEITLNHKIKIEDRIFEEDFVMRHEDTFLHFGNFLRMRSDFKLILPDQLYAQSIRRFFIIKASQKPNYTLPPFMETKSVLKEYENYASIIKKEFGVDPGKVIVDSHIPRENHTNVQWVNGNKDFVFVGITDINHNGGYDIIVGFLPGEIEPEEWRKAPYAAMGHLHKGTEYDKDFERQFAPNRRPDLKCFSLLESNSKEYIIQFTKKWKFNENDRYGYVDEFGVRRPPKPMPYVGLMFFVSENKNYYVYRNNKVFSEKRNNYNPMDFKDATQFKTYFSRFLVYSGMNVEQLKKKVESIVGEDGYNKSSEDSSE